jgi:hypothetical protein
MCTHTVSELDARVGGRPTLEQLDEMVECNALQHRAEYEGDQRIAGGAGDDGIGGTLACVHTLHEELQHAAGKDGVLFSTQRSRVNGPLHSTCTART